MWHPSKPRVSTVSAAKHCDDFIAGGPTPSYGAQRRSTKGSEKEGAPGMAAARRLAAILAADVAGYSRLMGVDEEGTHERLTAHLQELVDPKIKEHQGRLVKN